MNTLNFSVQCFLNSHQEYNKNNYHYYVAAYIKTGDNIVELISTMSY